MLSFESSTESAGAEFGEIKVVRHRGYEVKDTGVHQYKSDGLKLKVFCEPNADCSLH